MLYIKKKSTTKPITGMIVDSTNIDDKAVNTYSANIIDSLISNNASGGTELTEEMIQSIVDRAVTAAKLASHPIGSYYWSNNNTDPSELFGGTWERVKDKFLYALGDSGAAGDTGGASTVTLSKANLPNYTLYSATHQHGMSGYTMKWGGGVSTVAKTSSNAVGGPTTSNEFYVTGTTNTTATTITVKSGGSDTPFSIIPPHIKAYCWKRIS